MWNLLQLSDVLDHELAAALAESVQISAWQPERHFAPSHARADQLSCRRESPNLTIYDFPIIRGYARFPVSHLVPTNRILLELLLKSTPDPGRSPLIITVPYFAELADSGQGRSSTGSQT